jgi:hypothetical protein
MGPCRAEGKEYSIMAGVYIHDLAPYIIRDIVQNQIAGLMLDTTSAVMRRYVTAIPVAISGNTAIALRLLFGPAEAIERYKQFYTAFAQYDIDRSGDVFEADQGVALVSLFKNHRNANLHLICFHHFLKTLKDRRFAVYVAFPIYPLFENR